MLNISKEFPVRLFTQSLTLAVASLVMLTSVTFLKAQDSPKPPTKQVPPPAPKSKTPPTLDRAFEITALPTFSANTYVARVLNKSKTKQHAHLVVTLTFADGKTKSFSSREFHLQPGENKVVSVDQHRVPIQADTKVSVRVEPVRR